MRRMLAAFVAWAPLLATAAEPRPVDDRCGSEIVLAAGAPEDGWTRPANGRVPGNAVDPAMAARHPQRILLAEDDFGNQQLAMRLRQQMGYRADLATNGVEAVAAVGRDHDDGVLMDVQMPEMDGLEATRRILEDRRADRPRIVAMTANAMQGDRESCIAAGMDDDLSKPIRIDQFVDALSNARPRKDVPIA